MAAHLVVHMAVYLVIHLVAHLIVHLIIDLAINLIIHLAIHLIVHLAHLVVQLAVDWVAHRILTAANWWLKVDLTLLVEVIWWLLHLLHLLHRLLQRLRRNVRLHETVLLHVCIVARDGHTVVVVAHQFAVTVKSQRSGVQGILLGHRWNRRNPIRPVEHWRRVGLSQRITTCNGRSGRLTVLLNVLDVAVIGELRVRTAHDVLFLHVDHFGVRDLRHIDDRLRTIRRLAVY